MAAADLDGAAAASPSPRPSPDADELRRALAALHDPDTIVELRAIHKGGRKRTDAGYFDGDHRDALVREAVRLNRAGVPVYVTLNRLDPQLLSRYSNRVQEWASDTTTDAYVLRRCWLPIDTDPLRPKNTSATAEQLAAALDCTRMIRDHLAACGWPDPVEADSGNGGHLLYPIDLPNDEDSRELVKRCLEALAARFDDEIVKLDRSVFNAARIWKLYGTIATKGDNVVAAPWRLSRIRAVPEDFRAVPPDLLHALAAEAEPHEQQRASRRSPTGRAWTEADVAAFLERGGIEAAEPDTHEDARRWKLVRCPFNEAHGFGEAAVFLRDGRLGFKCQHDHCEHYHWSDLRELVDGPHEQRAPRSAGESRAGQLPAVQTEGSPSQPDQRSQALPRIVIRRAADVAASLPRAAYVLRPYVEHNAIAVLYGDFGTYKSFVVVDWAMRIGLGLPAIGHRWPTPPAPAVIVSAEGRGLPARLRGWCIRNRASEDWREVLEDAPVYCIEHPVNLSDPENALALVAEIQALGIEPAAVFIDTLSRNSDGRVETSTADAAAYLAVVDQYVRVVYRCAVVLVHHVGHAEKGRLRGPIVLAANTDALIRVERPESEAKTAVLTVERLKDAEVPAPSGLKADVVELGETDDDGQPITTLALSETDVPVTSGAAREPSGKAQRQLLAALRARGDEIWTIADLREIGRQTGLHRNTARSAVEALTFSPWLTATVGGWKLSDSAG